MVKLAGGVPSREGGRRLVQAVVKDITEKIGSYTKAIVLNSPNNRRASCTRRLHQEIVALCEKKNIWLLMDDLYNRPRLRRQEGAQRLEYAKNVGDSSRLVLVQGVSKMYAMTGSASAGHRGTRSSSRR